MERRPRIESGWEVGVPFLHQYWQRRWDVTIPHVMIDDGYFCKINNIIINVVAVAEWLSNATYQFRRVDGIRIVTVVLVRIQ